MNYHIEYDVAAAVLSATIIFFNKIKNPGNSKSKRYYQWLLWITLVSAVLDAVTGITDSNPFLVSRSFNMFLNIVFFIISVGCGYTYFRYTSFLCFKTVKKNLLEQINEALMIIYFLFIILNVKTGWIFTLDNNVYAFGKLHSMTYVLPAIYIIEAEVLVIVYRKKFEFSQFLTIALFGPFTGVGMMLQMLLSPETLIIYFATSIGCLGLLFTIETPDYEKLMETMELLEQARETAETATRAKSSFLARMSHEIRTPINAVVGMDDLIIRNAADPKILGYACKIKSAGESLLSIINDILDFSAIESGKMNIVPAQYKTETLIKDCVNLINESVKDKGLEFKLDVAENVPSVLYGDVMRVRQIIVNLLTNAVKYTEQGSVSLAFTWKDTVREDDCNGEMTISVSDTGKGIAPENTDKLFNSFERVDIAANHEIEGTGLGLPITKQLAELMGGFIKVDSRLSKGSTFTVVIPQKSLNDMPVGKIDQSVDPEDFKKSASTDFEKEGASILVVDDSIINLEVFTGLLEQTKIQIDTALSGEESIALANSKKYDLIFMDHMMPQMDGVEAMKRIKESPRGMNADTPFIVLTANAVNGAKQFYINEGFTAYLSKPIIVKEVNDLLKEMLS